MNPVTIDASACTDCCWCDGPTSGSNVFSITEEEYLAYYKGGTWSITWSLGISESWTEQDEDGNDVTVTTSGSGSATVTGSGSGCKHEVNADISYSYTGTDGVTVTNTDGPLYFELLLGKSGDSYYAFFAASVWNISSTGDDTGYPPTATATAHGNSLNSGHLNGLWNPGSSGADDYTNDSWADITARFIPNT
jgi:hypothetical protein